MQHHGTEGHERFAAGFAMDTFRCVDVSGRFGGTDCCCVIISMERKVVSGLLSGTLFPTVDMFQVLVWRLKLESSLASSYFRTSH